MFVLVETIIRALDLAIKLYGSLKGLYIRENPLPEALIKKKKVRSFFDCNRRGNDIDAMFACCW